MHEKYIYEGNIFVSVKYMNYKIHCFRVTDCLLLPLYLLCPRCPIGTIDCSIIEFFQACVRLRRVHMLAVVCPFLPSRVFRFVSLFSRSSYLPCLYTKRTRFQLRHRGYLETFCHRSRVFILFEDTEVDNCEVTKKSSRCDPCAICLFLIDRR